MKRALATVCMSGSLANKLAAAAEAGFDGVEIFENDLTFFDSRPEDVRDLAASLGLEMIALQPFRDFEGLPEPQRSRAFERARRKFDLMLRLGTPLLVVCSSVSPDAVDDIARVAATCTTWVTSPLNAVSPWGFEALSWGRHINDYRHAWDAVRRADHPRIGLILDTFHTLARKCPTDAIATIPPDKIVLVQTADAPGIEMDLLFLSRHYRCFPGQGDLAVVDMMRRIADIGYAGWISHEIFSDDFRAGSARQTAIDGTRSFLWLGEQIGTRPPLPPAPASKGIEFVEFVDDPAQAETARELLGALGFGRPRRGRQSPLFRRRRAWLLRRRGGAPARPRPDRDRPRCPGRAADRVPELDPVLPVDPGFGAGRTRTTAA